MNQRQKMASLVIGKTPLSLRQFRFILIGVPLYIFPSPKTFQEARPNTATADAEKKDKKFSFLLMIKFIFPHSPQQDAALRCGLLEWIIHPKQDFFYIFFLLLLLCVKQHQFGTPRKCRKKDQGPLRNEFVLIMRLPVLLGAVFGISILGRALIITGGAGWGSEGSGKFFIFIWNGWVLWVLGLKKNELKWNWEFPPQKVSSNSIIVISEQILKVVIDSGR